jgi:hypothetical protein
LKPPGRVGSPVRAGRDVDSAGRVPDFLVAEAELEAELESEDSAGKEAELLPAELLPESVADESDDVADAAVGDDAVGIATFPVLLRVGRAED